MPATTAAATATAVLLLSAAAVPPLAAASDTPVMAQATQAVCKGDTRGDRRCNHDPTHRVCARIGDPDTSFWGFTGQHSWCGTIGYYGGQYGDHVRCPRDTPTWCICKWATASWIQGETCNEQINIDCEATDICATELGLFFSYNDFDVNLHPARECVQTKCAEQWQACEAANPNFTGSTASGAMGGGGTTSAMGLLLCVVTMGVVALGYRLRYQRNAAAAASASGGSLTTTSPGAPARSRLAGTMQAPLQYGQVSDGSDAKQQQPSRQSQYV